jgi:hypothetical protein
MGRRDCTGRDLNGKNVSGGQRTLAPVEEISCVQERDVSEGVPAMGIS